MPREIYVCEVKYLSQVVHLYQGKRNVSFLPLSNQSVSVRPGRTLNQVAFLEHPRAEHLGFLRLN